MQHEELGEIAIQVGSYEKDGKPKKRFRRIGTLMRTTYDDGGKSEWLRLNADALNPSLLIIARAYMEKGSDSALLSVFPKRKQAAASEPEAGADTEPEDIPY